MNKFIIGLILGLVLGASGAYKVVTNKIKKVATIENAEKFANASREFGGEIVDICK